MALAGKDVKIELTGTATSMSDELCSDIDSSGQLVWRIDDLTKDVWDLDTTFTVEYNNDVGGGGTWQTASPSNYDLRYLVGVVEFATDPFSTPPDPGVRISGKYLPKYEILEGFSADHEIARQLLDATKFGDDFQRRINGLLEASGSFGLYEVLEKEIDDPSTSEATLEEILLGRETRGGSGDIETNIVFSQTNDRDASAPDLTRIWVQFESLALDVPVDDIQNKTISFQSNQRDAAMSSQESLSVDILKEEYE